MCTVTDEYVVRIRYEEQSSNVSQLDSLTSQKLGPIIFFLPAESPEYKIVVGGFSLVINEQLIIGR